VPLSPRQKPLRSLPKTRDSSLPAPARPVRPSLIVGLSLVGLAVAVASGLSAPVTEVQTGAQFGLLQLLPPTYWFGVILMGSAVGLALLGRFQKTFVLAGVLLFAVFAGTPILFEPNPPIWDSYGHLSEAQAVGWSGHLAQSMDQYAANWPGFFLIAWYGLSMSNLTPLQFMALFPFLTGGLTFLAVFEFLRSRFPPNMAGIGSVLASFLNVWGQYHLSPQSFGLFLLLLILASVPRTQIRWRIACVILYASLVVSHPTSTVLLLAVLFADAAIGWVSRLRRKLFIRSMSRPHGRPQGGPALAFGVTWLGWLLFRAIGSSQATETAILARIGAILQIPEQAAGLVTARTVENVYPFPPVIRLAGIAVVGVVALLSLLAVSRKPNLRPAMRFMWASLAGIIFVGLLDLLVFQGMFIDRAFMLFAILAPAVCLYALPRLSISPRVRQTVVVVLLGASLAVASTAYYQESFYFVSGQAVAVSTHLQLVNPNSLVLDGFYPAPVWIDIPGRTPFAGMRFLAAYPRPFEDFAGNSSVYAVYDPTASLWYRQWGGLDVYRFYEGYESNYSRIYDNGRSQIYAVYLPGAGG